MNSLIILIGLFVGLTCADNDVEWDTYKSKFGLKSVFHGNSTKEKERKAVWSKNINSIKSHNQEYAKGAHSYTMTANKFSFLTYEEFLAEKTGYKRSAFAVLKLKAATIITTTTRSSTTTTRPTTTTMRPTTTTMRPTTMTMRPTTTTMRPTTTTSTLTLQESFNWTSSYLVGPIKDQANCGYD